MVTNVIVPGGTGHHRGRPLRRKSPANTRQHGTARHWPFSRDEKLLFQHEIFGHQRFLIQFSVGTLPHRSVMRSIELFGTEAAPAVREEIARRTSSSEAAA
jgi:hypothetical protein